MKPRELKIGNWLKVDGLPFRVAQVSTPTVAGDLYDGFILENGIEDEGEAIPLTENILYTMGWIGTGWSMMTFEQDKPERKAVWFLESHLLEVTRDDSTYYESRRKTMLSIYCDSVHELQNALEVCGITLDFELKPSDV